MATLLHRKVSKAARQPATRPENSGKTSLKCTNLYSLCIIAVLTRGGPVRTNTLMAHLANILQLIRVTALLAMILALGFSLPSAAHAIAGHHGNAAVPQSGESHTASALHGTGNDIAQTGAHHGHDKSQTSDIGSCCSGSCMADAVLTFLPEKTSLAEPLQWKQENSQLPSREQLALLRPPKT